MTATLTYTGTVEALHDMDQGRAAGVSMRLADGRSVYLRLPATRRDAMDDATRDHLAAGREIALHCRPIPPRLGVPVAEVVSATLPRAA